MRVPRSGMVREPLALLQTAGRRKSRETENVMRDYPSVAVYGVTDHASLKLDRITQVDIISSTQSSAKGGYDSTKPHLVNASIVRGTPRAQGPVPLHRPCHPPHAAYRRGVKECFVGRG